jgi:plasmid maintenance system killer protein
VIRSFRNKETEKIFRREFSRKFQSIAVVAKRKLDQIHAAAGISDLGAIPGIVWKSWPVIDQVSSAFG